MTKKDFPDGKVKAGDVGTVICVFTYPDEAYEVEFSDGQGGVRATLTVRPGDIELYEE